MGEFIDGELSKDPSTLKHHPALVLNADYRPLSYYPLSLWCWQDAVKQLIWSVLILLLSTISLFIVLR